MSIVEEHFPKLLEDVAAETRKPVVGSFCAYVPEEVVHACGAHPIHIEGQRASSVAAQSCLPSNLCPYVRSCFDWAASAEAQFLRGAVFTDSCNAMQRLHDVWEHIGTPFVRLLDVPRIRTEQSERFFAQGIKALGNDLAAHLGKEGWEAALPESITLYERSRTLLTGLAELRRAEKVELPESEYLRLLQIARYWDRADFNLRLEALIGALEARGCGLREDGAARILITGSMSISRELVALVESTGARVVYTDLCTTSRYADKRGTYAGGPPEAYLSSLYLNQIPCARMKDADARMRHLLAIIEETGADGVVYSVPQFCDTFLFEYSTLHGRLEKRRVRDLLIESDYTANNAGQLRTKIEAFVEVLNG